MALPRRNREQPTVETLPRSRSGGEPLGVDQGLEVRLDALEGFATPRCAQLGGELAQQCGALLESGTFECSGGDAEFHQLLGRDGEKAAERPGAQPPMALPVAPFTGSRGSNAASAASRRRSAVLRLTPKSLRMSSRVSPPYAACRRTARRTRFLTRS